MKTMKRKKVKSQAILEYILVLTAIVLAILWATRDENSAVQKAVRNMFVDAMTLIEDKTSDFATQGGGGYYSANR